MNPITLDAFAWEAVLAPQDGGGMTALRYRGHDILVPAPAGVRLGGPYGAFWMIPWTNRLDGGRLGAHRLPVNRAEDGTAIHGLSRDRPWQVTQVAPDHVMMTQEVAAGPYRYRAELLTAAGAAGLRLELAIFNAGDVPMPFGAGWHPWFVRPPGTRLALRATTRFARDDRCLPTEAIASTGLDGDEAAFIGFDTHFAGWDGRARIDWPGLRLTITATGALSTNLQLYAPSDKAVLCVEPSSHLPDAPNRPDLARHGPMRVLEPGENLTGRILLVAESSHMPKGGA